MSKHKRAGRLVLGGAQFGLAYGATNAHGQLSGDRAIGVLNAAREAGISLIDAAAAYGNAEESLGQLGAAKMGFGLITKTRPLSAIAPENGKARAEIVLAQLADAPKRLDAHPLEAVLVHHAGDLVGEDGAILWAGLEAFKATGHTKNIGFSAYIDDDVVGLAKALRPDIIQIPMSILDQRPVTTGVVDQLADLGVQVHIRSIFLQGLLIQSPNPLPKGLLRAQVRLEQIRAGLAAENITPLLAALSYVFAQNVDKIILGVSSQRELTEILDCLPKLAQHVDWAQFGLDDAIALDPRKWH